MKKILSALIVAAATLYGIIPVDAIPDLAPPVTYVDDLGVGLALLLLAAIIYFRGGSEMSQRKHSLPPFDDEEGELNSAQAAETEPEGAGQRRPSLLAVSGTVTGAGRSAVSFLDRRSPRTRGVLLVVLLAAIAFLFVSRGGVTSAPPEARQPVSTTTQAVAAKQQSTFTPAGPTPTFDASGQYTPTEADKAATAGQYLVIPKVQAVINGSLDEGESPARFVELERIRGDSPDEIGCLVGYAETGVYVACVVKDDTHVAGSGLTMWLADEVEVLFAPQHGAAWTMVGFSVQKDLTIQAFRWFPEQARGELSLQTKATALDEQASYFLETLVSWTELGLTGVPVNPGHLAVCVTDWDEAPDPAIPAWQHRRQNYFCSPAPGDGRMPTELAAAKQEYTDWWVAVFEQ